MVDYLNSSPTGTLDSHTSLSIYWSHYKKGPHGHLGNIGPLETSLPTNTLLYSTSLTKRQRMLNILPTVVKCLRVVVLFVSSYPWIKSQPGCIDFLIQCLVHSKAHPVQSSQVWTQIDKNKVFFFLQLSTDDTREDCRIEIVTFSLPTLLPSPFLR